MDFNHFIINQSDYTKSISQF